MSYSNCILSPYQFVHIIEVMRDREDLVGKIDDLVREYRQLINDDFIDSNSIIIGGETEILELLEVLMKDNNGVISWFMWEMDFGRAFEMGDFTWNGHNVDLSTAEKLYDYLIKTNFSEE